MKKGFTTIQYETYKGGHPQGEDDKEEEKDNPSRQALHVDCPGAFLQPCM